MGMMSEIATDATIRSCVKYVDTELKKAKHPETIAALKAVGRGLLTEFEWETPDWAKDKAKEYTK